jgi:hypothetical protein
MSASENFFQIFDNFKKIQFTEKLQSELKTLKDLLYKTQTNIFEIDDILTSANEIFKNNKFDNKSLTELIEKIIKNVVIKKNPEIPIQVKAKFINNQEFQTSNSVGIALLGGGEAAQVWSVAVYSMLFNLGILDNKYIDSISNVSGACWGGPVACYDKFDNKLNKLPIYSQRELFTEYLEPQNIIYTDLINKKPFYQLLNNASNPLKILTFINNFIKNIFDPNVPYNLVVSNSFSQDTLEQFNMFSTKSLVLNTVEDYYQLDPALIEKVSEIYILKENMPDIGCMTAGYVPVKTGLAFDDYTFFPMAMNSKTAGVIANQAIISGNAFDSFEIGGTITNYACGGIIKSTDEKKNAIIELSSVYQLMSINQMVGNSSSAVLQVFNNIEIFDIFAHTLYLSSEKTNPSQEIFNNDLAVNYDESGITYLLSQKTKHIICYISCGDKIIINDNDPYHPNNKIPKSILDIFSITQYDLVVNLKPELNRDDYPDTILGISNSPNGIYRRKYITVANDIDGIEEYEVEITWVYFNVTEWKSLLNPISKFFLDLGAPNWPYLNNIIEKTSLFPLQSNAYFYYISWQFLTFIYPYILSIKK